LRAVSCDGRPPGSLFAERSLTADSPILFEVTKMKRQSCALLLMWLAAAGSTAMAASQSDQDKACRSDAFRLCSSDIPNKEKIEACMKQHYDQLSPPCKKMFKSSDNN
jgi:hypothetical protein